MAFEYGFYDAINGDRKYTARDFGKLFDGLISDGVFEEIGDRLFTTCTGTDMRVSVGTGKAWFNHTYSLNTSPMVFTLSGSHPVMSRYDMIVLEINDEPVIDGRENKIKLIEGDVSSNPTKPTLINSTFLHQYPLAYIKINPGAETITASNIEITVGQDPCPFVTGIVETADITDLFAAWNDQFTVWFDNLKKNLSGDVVTNIQNQLDIIDKRLEETDTSINEINTSMSDINNKMGINNPIGKIMLLADAISTMPNGYLLANGASVSRTEYNELYNAIGSSYGGTYSADGVTCELSNEVYDFPSDFADTHALYMGTAFTSVPGVGWVYVNNGALTVYEPYKTAVTYTDTSIDATWSVCQGHVSMKKLMLLNNTYVTFITFDDNNKPVFNSKKTLSFSGSSSYNPTAFLTDSPFSYIGRVSSGWHAVLKRTTSQYYVGIYYINESSGSVTLRCGMVNPGASSYWNYWIIFNASDNTSGGIGVGPKGTSNTGFPVFSCNTSAGMMSSMEYAWGTSKTSLTPTIMSGCLRSIKHRRCRGSVYSSYNPSQYTYAVVGDDDNYVIKVITNLGSSVTSMPTSNYGSVSSTDVLYAMRRYGDFVFFFLSNTMTICSIRSDGYLSSLVSCIPYKDSTYVLGEYNDTSPEVLPICNNGKAITNATIIPDTFKLPTISISRCKACIKAK